MLLGDTPNSPGPAGRNPATAAMGFGGRSPGPGGPMRDRRRGLRDAAPHRGHGGCPPKESTLFLPPLPHQRGSGGQGVMGKFTLMPPAHRG